MKKRLFFICIILISIFLYFYNPPGKTNNVTIQIGKSNKFNQEEITDAINCVKENFKDFNGCKLIKLRYNEEKSNNLLKDYFKYNKELLKHTKAENTIILLSDFDTGILGINGELEPNSTYTNWSWLLIRNNKTDKWQIYTNGY